MINFISPKDCRNLSVKVGDKVRLLSVPKRLLERVPEDEAENLKSMVGDVFTVDEIDEHGGVWVEKVWEFGDDKIHSHSIRLNPEEMELIQE